MALGTCLSGVFLRHAARSQGLFVFRNDVQTIVFNSLTAGAWLLPVSGVLLATMAAVICHIDLATLSLQI